MREIGQWEYNTQISDNLSCNTSKNSISIGVWQSRTQNPYDKFLLRQNANYIQHRHYHHVDHGTQAVSPTFMTPLACTLLESALQNLV